MNVLTLTGRILYDLPFAVIGLGHFGNASHMASMVPIPGGVFWVYLTGVALVTAAVSIASGKLVKLSAILLAVLLLIFVITIFIPGLGNEQMKQMAFMGLLKDTSLAGAALFIAGTSGSGQKSHA